MFIGFGSMVSAETDRLSGLVATAGQLAGARTVIQAGRAGLTLASQPYKRLSAPALAAAIRDALTRPSYRTRAQALASRLAREDGTEPVIKALARLRG